MVNEPPPPDRTTAFRVMLLTLVASFATGCATIESVLEEAVAETIDQRAEGLEELTELLGDARGDDPKSIEVRRQANRFVLDRFEHDESGRYREPDPTLRSQLLSIAVAAELDGAKELVIRAARDRSSALVRHHAVQHMRDFDVAGFREQLVDLLRAEKEYMVRIEVIKTMAEAQVPESERLAWIDPILAVYLEPTEDPSVRLQACRALRRLSGQSFHFESVAAWRKWRERFDS